MSVRWKKKTPRAPPADPSPLLTEAEWSNGARGVNYIHVTSYVSAIIASAAGHAINDQVAVGGGTRVRNHFKKSGLFLPRTEWPSGLRRGRTKSLLKWLTVGLALKT